MCYGLMAVREGIWLEHLDSDSEGELGEYVPAREEDPIHDVIGRVWA